MKKKAVWISLGLGALFWLGDALVHTFVFHREDLATQLFSTPHHDLYTRLLIMLAIIAIAYSGFMVAERRRMEKVLRESEHQYRNLFESSKDAIYITRRDGAFLKANQAAVDLFGYPKNELIGLDIRKVYANPEDRPRFQEEIERKGFLWDYEIRFKKKDGAVMDCLLTSNLVVDEQGAIVGYQGIIRDMTERKKMEAHLFQITQDWEDIFNAITDMITVHDRDFHIIRANRAADQILGLPFLTVTRAKCFEYYHGTGNPPEGCPSCEVLKSGIASTSEIFEPHLNRFIEVRAIPRYDRDRNLVGLIHVVRDITKRKEAEDLQRKHLDFLQVLIDTIPAPIFYKDAKGAYIGCNKAFEDYIGRKKEQLVGKTVYDIAPKELADIYYQADLDLFTRRGIQTYESEVSYADGSRHNVIFEKATFSNPDGTLGGLIGVILDITERKRLEDQLRQAQKMEAIGQLAGGVAHDFNNILSAILGYGHLLLMKMEENDPQRTNVEQILSASERAATLTHSLLAFSRKQTISLKLVDLNELVKRFEKFLLRLIGEDIELRTVCSSEELVVMADGGQIEQVIMNLVTNARDAMPDGGKLTVSTASVRLDEEWIKIFGYGKEGRYALLEVADTGIGMDAQTREKIFEPFFTTKEKGKGTGLGLAMVYGIVKQHDGYITLESEPGRGTTFSIYLPLVRPDADLHEQEREAAVPVRGGIETILVAEDDEPLRKLASTVLRQFGYTVIEAVDGEDAVAKFSDHRDAVKLLVLDVIMPRKNGREVFEAIKAVRPDIRALFVSGYSSDVINRKGVTEEGADFILKPVSPRDLLGKVREILDA